MIAKIIKFGLDKFTQLMALGLLFLMLVLMFFSSLNDSATFDEKSHIASGYSYLTQRHYRLNPEHPPLIKDLAALPLLFLDLKFPNNPALWREKLDGLQWDVGENFLYKSGNNADKILRLARLPIMLLALIFGWLLFRWVKGFYGNKVAVLVLFFFALSPTFLAHSRYVTTDLGAAFGFFAGLAVFLNFLFKEKNENANKKKELLLSGVVLGVALLIKFSLMLLVPFYVILGILWVFLNNSENFNWRMFLKKTTEMIFKIILIGIVALFIIWLVYLYHIWQYPIGKQLADTEELLSTFKFSLLSKTAIWMSGLPVIRALGHYFTGLLMTIQRATAGNNAYFMGEVTARGWHYYFPVLYFFKEPLAFQILMIIALGFAIKKTAKSDSKNLKTFLTWLRENFVLTASLIFIFVYWANSIASPLNIGIRHLLPTFPFIYLLVSREIIIWVKSRTFSFPLGLKGWLKTICEFYLKPVKRFFFVAILLIWIFISMLFAFPYYLSYFNELGGGVWNGYKIAVDSNYDWGQDLKRLKSFVEKNKINKIALDYFGGGDPNYYLGTKFEPWWSAKGKPKGWFAVSLNTLQGAWAKPVKGFVKKNEDDYNWLKGENPFARAGTSIFIYRF
jgi:4-amino-4-deoxy-L-arabinose transferase-like glycosyltransferase